MTSNCLKRSHQAFIRQVVKTEHFIQVIISFLFYIIYTNLNISGNLKFLCDISEPQYKYDAQNISDAQNILFLIMIWVSQS